MKKMLLKTVSFAVFSLVFSSSAMATTGANTCSGTCDDVYYGGGGGGNIITGQTGGTWNHITGNHNTIDSSVHYSIVGDENRINNSGGQPSDSGKKNFSGLDILGGHNTINDSSGLVVSGSANTITNSNYSSIVGENNNLTDAKNSSILGSDTTVTSSNSVTLGHESTNDRDNTVSVGSSGSERQITNVQAGTQDTDAVNVGQLNSVKNNVTDLTNQVNQNTTNIANNTSQINQNVTNIANNTSQINQNVTNIANNTSQINQNTTNIGNNTTHINKNTVDIADLKIQQNAFEHSTNKRFESVYERMGELRKEYQGGIASAVAMSHIPQSFDYGSATIGVGMGNFRDGVAIAVGGSRISDNGNWTTKFSVSANTNRDSLVGIGIGYNW